jgi:hypothetical protein
MHQHDCRCGLAWLDCAHEDCAVIEPWTCPNCDAEERDLYWQAVELDTITAEKETDRADHCDRE